MGGVIISPNIKKESVRIDRDGNIINPQTKQIIVKADEPVVVPTEPNEPQEEGKENTG